MTNPRKHPLPSIEHLRSIFDYDPVTGDITFRPRQSARWNARYAGSIAGSVQKSGYRTIHCRRAYLLAHRVAWAIYHGEWPDSHLDHRDNDKTNNSLANLRRATMAENLRNRRGWNSLGYKGVRRFRDRFAAMIWHQRKSVWLGVFDTVELASQAYNQAALRFHGEYANLLTKNIGVIRATIKFNNAPSIIGVVDSTL